MVVVLAEGCCFVVAPVMVIGGDWWTQTCVDWLSAVLLTGLLSESGLSHCGFRSDTNLSLFVLFKASSLIMKSSPFIYAVPLFFLLKSILKCNLCFLP